MLWLIESFCWIILALLRYAFKDRLLAYIWKNKKMFNSIRLILWMVVIALGFVIWDFLQGNIHYKIIFIIEVIFILWLHEIIQSRIEIVKEISKQ